MAILKLEKGQDFGDAILDNVNNKDLSESQTEGIHVLKKNGDQNEAPIVSGTVIASTSIFSEVKKSEKTLCVVAEKSILDGYHQYWKKDDDSSIVLLESSKSKESVEKACEACFKHNLTLCHLDAKTLSDEKKWSKVKKWTKKMWSHTSINGLFVTVWTGTEEQNAFVGVALNKASND